MKEAANARKNESLVLRQNFRKKTPAVMEAVAITPNRNPSIISLLAFPDQAVKQKDHGNCCGAKPQTVKVHIRKHHQVHKDQKVRNRKAGKAQAAPEKKLFPDLHIVPQKQKGTAETRQSAEDVDGLEWISTEIRTNSRR